MKKTLVSALTTALVVGAASTTFAASNPFSDVPADHWAYDAVAQLAADGVIEGYGDTTFRGNQSITRYEMAQMVAKAMAKTDVSAADKALIDKLYAAEFLLMTLHQPGVRVSNLERNADMVEWNGQARYTYRSLRTEQENGSKDRDNSDKLLLRLEPSAEVNDHWHVNARLDATTEMSDDKGDGDNHDEDKITLKRVYAQGNYKNFQTQLGKFGLYTPEQGLVFDSDNSMSGANVTFGNALKATIYAGRIDVSDQEKGYQLSNRDFDDTANMQGITLQYATPANKWSGGAAYYHLNTNDFIGLTDGLNNGEGYTNGKNDEDNANIWSANLGYNFDNTSRLFAAYANNTSADNLDKSWQAIYSYKGAQPENKNTWGAYAAYRYLGTYTSIFGTEDAQVVGAKGWEVGANYAPFHNVLATAKYFNGKGIDSDRDVDTLWGRIQFFF